MYLNAFIFMLLIVFKCHSERRKKNSRDSEVQTDVSSVSTPLMNPAAVASLLENASSVPPNKRRKGYQRKEHQLTSLDRNWANNGRRPVHLNFNNSDSQMKFLTPSGSYYDRSVNNTQSVIEESIVPFDVQMNSGMLTFDEHGILNFGDNDSCMSGSGNPCSSSKTGVPETPNMNGYPVVDGNSRKLSNPFRADADADKSYNLVDLDSAVASQKSSPLTYTDLDSVNSRRPSRGGEKEKSRYATCEICNKTMLKVTIKQHMDQVHGGIVYCYTV